MQKVIILLAKWYTEESKFKRFISLLVAHLYVLSSTFTDQISDAKKRSYLMQHYGIIKHPCLIFLDMLFSYIILGHFPSTYSAHSFYQLSTKQRVTFMPIFENKLLSISINKGLQYSTLKKHKSLKEFYRREQIFVKNADDYIIFEEFVRKHKIFFYKSLKSSKVKYIETEHIQNINLKSFFNDLIYKGPFVIEEVVKQCKELASVYHSSVNTIRLVMFRTNSQIEFLSGCLKCEYRGNIADNEASRWIFIPFDLKTGKLFEIGFDHIGNKFRTHPDTNIVFDNFVIPRYDEVKSFATQKSLII